MAACQGSAEGSEKDCPRWFRKACHRVGEVKEKNDGNMDDNGSSA